jgi:uncharacterized membrane protein YoaT (DUF817 family)
MISKAHKRILKILEHNTSDKQLIRYLKEFLCFGYKEAISCIFPVIIFGSLAITKFVSVPFIPRYDLLLIIFLIVQYLMFKFNLKDAEEVNMICLFHVLGIMMEIYKVSHNSWAYPEHAYAKVLDVPLYSGFMYASIASYICQAWRNLDLKLEAWPNPAACFILAVLIYGNFYTNVHTYDIRLILIPALFLVFYRTSVYFNTNGQIRKMPMIVSFFLIAFFVWLAENIATFLGAWKYPNQAQEWRIVSLHIMSSWFLLVIVTIILVALIKHYRDDESIEASAKNLEAI